jgi:DNA (cytosine-5)-methyltransferase 1
MKHYGDITKLDGHNLPLVDIVTGGSPCQDLSVAGKRAGLAGERSGLFMEQVRIIKEMRDESTKQLRLRGADVNIRNIQPRYMVWENVPGAFSSNKGEDFRAVLEETAKIVCEDAVIPRPENGKWTPSGVIMGDGWSIAWRVHDAQFWGVPQRRKRIALVADFGGDTASKILFESESLPRDSETSREEGQGTANNSERGADPSSYTLKIRGGVEVDSHGKKAGKGPLIQTELSGTLGVSQDQTLITNVVYGICSANSNSMKSPNPYSGIYKADTSRTLDLNGGSPACNQGGMICLQRRFSSVSVSEDGITPTLEAGAGEGGNNMPIVLEGNGQRDSHKGNGYKESETMYTLNTVEQHGVVYSMGHDIRSAKFTADEITDPLTATDYKDPIKINDNRKTYQNITGTLDCGITKGTGNQLANSDMFIANTSVVRRLTPMECERLQGYPDHWTDIGEWTDSKGKKHKDADSPRYKALGNSIALPFWEWMAKRMVKHLGKENPTMASLFDGISGFPLVYARAGVETKWTSEIEEFPIAVCKKHFGDEDTGEVGDYEKYL